MRLYQKIYLKMLEKGKGWSQEHNFPGSRGNSDKTFYIIRRSGMKLGLFSIFNTNLARIDYAVKNGMIPVVDMQHFNNSYLEEGEFMVINAWEKFFEQPTTYTLEDAYLGRKIILSDAGVPENAPGDSMEFLENREGILTYWREMRKKYIRLKPSIDEYFKQEYGRLVGEEDKVLGVLARGTDYVKLQPSKHPIQPTTEQMILKVKEVMQMYGCNKVFLATEDKEIAEQFDEEFGNVCITHSKEYVDYKDGYLSEIVSERKNDKYIKGLEYLFNILMLANSNCIVAGRTSGTVGAALFSDGWEYSYFFDLGYYE